MFKRLLGCLVVWVFLASPLAVHADVLIDPNNHFYEKNQGAIIYLDRSFVANGENGSVAVKKAPDAVGSVRKLKNGEVVHMQFSCLYDGAFWGFTYEPSGWIKLDQMLVLYDYVAFAEDHLQEFYPYTGDYAKIKETRSAMVWPWPGADHSLYTFEDLDAGSLERFGGLSAYKDAGGREWGFIGYLYGRQNAWICLSDPLNKDLPALNPAPEPDIWVSETPHVDLKQTAGADGFPVLVVVIALVVALVAGTAVLIKVFWKPDQTNPEEKAND